MTVDGFGAAMWERCAHIWTWACRGDEGGGGGGGSANREPGSYILPLSSGIMAEAASTNRHTVVQHGIIG